jgi:hypothetical protein
MSDKKKPDRKVVMIPTYVLLDENTVVAPSAKVEYARIDELPESGNFYVLASEGLFIQKDGKLFKGLVPVKNLPGLASAESGCRLMLPKMPPLIPARALAFFRKVYKKHHAESELMLLYNPQEKLYELWCPSQEVSGGGVDYQKGKELTEAIAGTGYQWVGTIHSHANFGAYHSGIDKDDEGEGQGDAVHVTIGDVDRDYPSMSSEVAMSGARWKLAPENLMLGLVRKAAETASKQYYVSSYARDDEFDIELSEEERAAMKLFNEQIEEEWMPRVTKKTYGYSTTYYGSGWTGSGSTHSTHSPWSEELDEPEENGEWQLRNGHWQFLSDDELAKEAAGPTLVATDGQPLTSEKSEELFSESDGLTEDQKDAAIAEIADVEVGDVTIVPDAEVEEAT